ncbi:MAG: LamG domain-containing protein [Gemmatimonadetes bacterium]|nr:LamG domain-containing protein [Gemmatimonadota bacterium]MBT6149999.1 LamG domain-containing protein [Gemmatimonadota bacterium]MBT7863710.1 LamG domain-containing protein [Gemmatimonadota bacterium]
MDNDPTLDESLLDGSQATGTGEFSISLWAHTESEMDDVLGDLVSKYDPTLRKGFNFGFHDGPGVTSTHSNGRHLYFGMDNGESDGEWKDCGRPGKSVKVSGLAVWNGCLYAGSYEAGKGEAGHVYRYEGGKVWEDLGSPDPCNTVMSLAVCGGELFVGTGHYRAQGSSLAPSGNLAPGGSVYRYTADGAWEDCGKISVAELYDISVYSDWVQNLQGWSKDDVDTVGNLTVFNGKLYAMPYYHRGVYRYDGGTTWTHCGDPGCRLMSMGVFDGNLLGAGNEGNKQGGVFRYEGGTEWSSAGGQEGVDQVYSFAAYEGALHAGTWPEAKVFRQDSEQGWVDCGQLGGEQEVMAMSVYNGKLYAGTLPLAEVYRYDGGTTWTRLRQLDTTPDVKYRRVWSMAVFQGKLFCGTLPSGRVFSLEAGKSVTYDVALKSGWRHLVGVRRERRLELFVDGELVRWSSDVGAREWNISNDVPLRIGKGPHADFKGQMRDVQLHQRALSASDVAELFQAG